jgi:hypothetical protein
MANKAPTELYEHLNAIIKKIRKGCIFDAHFIIDQLSKLYPNVYLGTARKLDKTKEHQLNGNIANAIKHHFKESIEPVDKLHTKSWSKNINDTPSPCACWIKKGV